MKKYLIAIIIINILAFCNNVNKDKYKVDLSSVSDEQIKFMYSKLLQPYPSPANESENKLPLQKYGLFGLNFLEKALNKLPDKDIQTNFEIGFRNLFTFKTFLRNLKKSEDCFTSILDKDENNAYGTYGLGLTFLLIPSKNKYFCEKGISLLLKTIELDPKFGEAYYILAIIYSFVNKSKGFEYYQMSLSLNIEDEKKLGEAFYDDLYVKKEPAKN